MFKYVILCVAVIAGNWNVIAISKEEISKFHEAALPAIKECFKEFEVSEEAIATAKETKKLSGIDPCVVACIFKKVDIMVDDKIDVAKAIEKGSKFLSKDEDIKMFTGIAEKCTAASEKGEGCEVAKLYLECLGEYKAAFAPTD